jgi:hypothetical protein
MRFSPIVFVPSTLPLLLIASVQRHSPVYCIAVGDRVRVVSDVQVKGVNAKGLCGEVVTAHEESAEEWGACCELAWGQAPLAVRLARESRQPVVYCAYNEVALEEKRGERDAVSFQDPFVEGDRVRITDADVLVRGQSAKGRVGTVIYAWSQCETDPACCCNELATDAPLRVRLDLDEPEDPNDWREAVGYFHPNEVVVLRSDSDAQSHQY